ncbi:MAG: MurR/RpiR family transcriptional regulator [Hamadaea sp.]|nr:MurR/RpiR family transcriptional regulator [Hamadaea sp.]NUR48509.1 MurR/RpiR family transcriptional regulator [Hamadaea sp.]NUT02216.1 MurR/RpiR family transcriptional regulator [Hamadaea sp.]
MSADVAARLGELYADLPPGERAIARVLLDDYPYAALGSLRTLADRAGVSPPTASRLVGRLGYAGFAEFQEAVRTGARSRLRAFVAEPSDVESAAGQLRSALDECLSAVTGAQLTAAATRIVQAGSVWALGGRLSELAAEYLVRQLASLRPGVRHLPGSIPERARVLLDVTGADLLVAYDFRRYSEQTARFVTAARDRGARLLLITDAWESPLAEYADVLIRLPREAAGPIDPMMLSIAVTELLLVAVAGQLDPEQRLASLEELTQSLSH